MAKFSGQRLVELRGRRTQTDLALALRRRGHGTTQTQVSRWESGQAPRQYILNDLATELGATVKELYDDDDEEGSDAVADLLLSIRRLVREEVARA